MFEDQRTVCAVVNLDLDAHMESPLSFLSSYDHELEVCVKLWYSARIISAFSKLPETDCFTVVMLFNEKSNELKSENAVQNRMDAKLTKFVIMFSENGGEKYDLNCSLWDEQLGNKTSAFPFASKRIVSLLDFCSIPKREAYVRNYPAQAGWVLLQMHG